MCPFLTKYFVIYCAVGLEALFFWIGIGKRQRSWMQTILEENLLDYLDNHRERNRLFFFHWFECIQSFIKELVSRNHCFIAIFCNFFGCSCHFLAHLNLFLLSDLSRHWMSSGFHKGRENKVKHCIRVEVKFFSRPSCLHYLKTSCCWDQYFSENVERSIYKIRAFYFPDLACLGNRKSFSVGCG